jgi:hypothetical protein
MPKQWWQKCARIGISFSLWQKRKISFFHLANFIEYSNNTYCIKEVNDKKYIS